VSDRVEPASAGGEPECSEQLILLKGGSRNSVTGGVGGTPLNYLQVSVESLEKKENSFGEVLIHFSPKTDEGKC